MKRALLLVAAFIGSAVAAFSQVTSITVETFYVGGATPSVTGYPAGHTTYRIYANTTNATDRVTVVSGDDNAPLVLSVGGSGIWNHPQGGNLGDSHACNLYTALPALQYDSYMTIGYTCNDDGSAQSLYSAEDGAFPWQTQMFNTTPYGAGSVVVNSAVGGTWFALPNNTNTEAGADNKILLAQITTDGDICGILNLQVFPNYAGLGSPYVVQSGLEFGSTASCGNPGCTDDTALNYDAAADFNNGLCIYECALNVADLVVTNPDCAGDDNGSFSISVDGNQSYIEFFMNDQSYGLSADGGFGQSGLANGTYTVVAHDTRFDNENANPGGIYGSCEITEVITVETPELFMNNSTATSVTCAGDQDGCVTTNPSEYGGGTGALTFAIYSNGGTMIQDNLPDGNFCGLASGIYYFMVTDENGCTAQGSNFTVGNPGALAVIVGAQSPASCFNSSDAVQVLTWSGGTGDVDFSFEDDGVYEIEGNLVNVILNNLTPGMVTIYAADENGCTASEEFEVTGGPAITVAPMTTEPLCNGDANGSISVMAGGGTGSLEYSFDGGLNYSADATLSDLSAGDYSVLVRDENGCIAEENITLGEPAVLEASVAVSNISCNGLTDGQLSVTATGGNEPYAYAIVEPDYSPSPIIGDLAAGTYTVYVSDANGCAAMVENLEVAEPAALSATAAASNVLCNGDCNGSIAVTTNGGTDGFSFSVNGGTASSANPISDLCPGDYDVLVIDGAGCEFTVSGLSVAEPTALAINGLSADPVNSDPGGNTPYDVTGGTGDYTYSWTGPDGFSSNAQDLPDLGAGDDGDYTLTVTDENGCEVSQTITVTGISELGFNYSLSLYPNPNNGEFVISIAGMKGEKMSYNVVDAAGRIVVAKELGNVNGVRIENIDMKEAAAGFYNVQFTIGGQSQTLRFVKH